MTEYNVGDLVQLRGEKNSIVSLWPSDSVDEFGLIKDINKEKTAKAGEVVLIVKYFVPEVYELAGSEPPYTKDELEAEPYIEVLYGDKTYYVTSNIIKKTNS